MTVTGRGVFNGRWRMLRRFGRDDRGVTSIEYGLIASCIALAFVAIAILLGDDVGNMFSTLSDSVQGVTGD